MPKVVVVGQVEDTTKWEEGFRTHGDHFKNNMGVTGAIGFAINEGNEVAVCFEPADEAHFMAAMQTPENIAAMEQDGVKRDTVKVYVMDREFQP